MQCDQFYFFQNSLASYIYIVIRHDYLYSSFSWLTRFQMVYVYRKAGFFLAGHKLGGFKLNKVYHLEDSDSLTYILITSNRLISSCTFGIIDLSN